MDGTIFKHFSTERRARDIYPSAACSQASSLVPVSQLASSITAQPCDPCAQVSSVHVCVFVCACHGTGDGVYLHAEEGWWTWVVVFSDCHRTGTTPTKLFVCVFMRRACLHARAAHVSFCSRVAATSHPLPGVT